MGSYALLHYLYLYIPVVIILVLVALLSFYLLIRPTRWDPLKNPEEVKARPVLRVINAFTLIGSLSLLAAFVLVPLWFFDRVIEEHKTKQPTEQPSESSD